MPICANLGPAWSFEAGLIAQTLHGYEQGHRLLACGGDVNAAELALLDRLSDLSGYVPLDTEFEHYFTGFPCGRHYAFACTWPDRKATRAGTVLTHTLLIPEHKLDDIHDIWQIPGHRRPDSAFERHPYEHALPLDMAGAAQIPPTPAIERASAAIALWFGQPDRPALWVEEGGAEDVVRYLWSLLWGEARQRFSFCTFALQVRYLRRQPFGFLVLPPSAQGSFHDRARSIAWWNDGQLLNAALRERTTQPWAQTILEQGRDATHSMPRFCRDHALPMLGELAYPVFDRFVELEAPAKLRLAAARARADLLERLWPEVDPKHPLVGATLRQVLEHQGDAPLVPKPFWDLMDLIKRPAVRHLIEMDTAFAARLMDVVGREVERRLVEAENVGSIGTFLAIPMPMALRDEIIRAVARVFGKYPDDKALVAKGCLLVLASVEVRAPELVQAVLRALKPTARLPVIQKALQEVSEGGRDLLADDLLTAARELEDVDLVVGVRFALKQPIRALEDATEMVLSCAPVQPERLDGVLGRLDAEEQLRWALATSDARLAAWAGKKGSEAAKKLGLALADLIERGRNASNGNAVLLAYLEGISSSDVHDDALFAPAIAMAIAGDSGNAGAVKRIANLLAPQVVIRTACGSWSAERAGSWFALRAIQQALREASHWTLFSGYGGARTWDKDCLPNLARAIASSTQMQAPESLRFVANVLEKPLGDGYATSLSRATDDLLLVLSGSPELDGWRLLATHVLLAVRRVPSVDTYRLVERVFPVLYPAMLTGRLDKECEVRLRSVLWRDWDVAKYWRHWLLDQWLVHRWPPVAFLRALGDDTALFRRIAYRAWHKEKAKDFVKSLQSAWNNGDEWAKRWREPVSRFLADPDAKLDYE